MAVKSRRLMRVTYVAIEGSMRNKDRILAGILEGRSLKEAKAYIQ
jgi:hypothetical protein